MSEQVIDREMNASKQAADLVNRTFHETGFEIHVRPVSMTLLLFSCLHVADISNG